MLAAACRGPGPAAQAAGQSSSRGRWQLWAQRASEPHQQRGTPDVDVVGPVGNGAPGTSQSGGIGPNRDASAGTVDGVVQKVEVPSGRLTVQTPDGAVALRGRPEQLSRLRAGEHFVGTYQEYGVGARWLVIGSEPDIPFGHPGRATGTIVSVDEVNGTIVLDETLTNKRQRRSFHAHPAQLQALMPGQVATVWYRQVDGESWIQRYAAADTGTSPR
ncbi:MAG TPA: hypothetical protein VHG72_08440 [Polyangia bacterium]|nr:hypothetical protein [Polyangia bacterium]